MPFDAILGQEAAVGTLKRALSSGRIHHAYRFEGPAGVGKEMAAFAFAQALLCAGPKAPGAAHSLGCGKCSACTRAVTYSRDPPRVPLHPDVVLIQRGLYPPESIGRSRAELQDISIDQIRRIVLEHAAYGPHEGKARVFIVRDADELSTSAANALLKTLEEPLATTFFVLITSRGKTLLDTIRSRTQLVRFAPLPEQLVRQILEGRGTDPAVARTVAELSGGSVSAALELADPEGARDGQAFVDAVTSAVAAPTLAPALGVGEGRGRDKDALSNRLSTLAHHYAGLGREALVRHDASAARAAASRHEAVLTALSHLEKNGAVALVLESMIVRLRETAG